MYILRTFIILCLLLRGKILFWTIQQRFIIRQSSKSSFYFSDVKSAWLKNKLWRIFFFPLVEMCEWPKCGICLVHRKFDRGHTVVDVERPARNLSPSGIYTLSLARIVTRRLNPNVPFLFADTSLFFPLLKILPELNLVLLALNNQICLLQRSITFLTLQLFSSSIKESNGSQ